MVWYVGVLVVGFNLVNFVGKFNNGSVDFVYVFVVVYIFLEFYKGVEFNGVVVKYVIGYMNFQVIIYWD